MTATSMEFALHQIRATAKENGKETYVNKVSMQFVITGNYNLPVLLIRFLNYYDYWYI